jgi:hypothetical protein
MQAGGSISFMPDTPYSGQSGSPTSGISPAAVTPKASPTKIIFLDVDGVLHPEEQQVLFHEPACRQLERIIKTTGASVVLSSTWRKYKDKTEKLNKILDVMEIPRVYSRTPDYGGIYQRDAEICNWLDENGAGLTHWIAIDDFNLPGFNTSHSPRLVGHFVHVTSGCLKPGDGDLAIRLLTATDGQSLAVCPAALPPFGSAVVAGSPQIMPLGAAPGSLFLQSPVSAA